MPGGYPWWGIWVMVFMFVIFTIPSKRMDVFN
jgi:hypothetical protein